MLYPKVPVGTQLAAAALGFPVGIAVGLGIYALLRGLRRRGAFGAFLARWWAWFAGLVAGIGTAVGVAGPYVFAGPTRFGGMITTPLTVGEVFGIAGVLSFVYAGFELLPGRRSGVKPPVT